ncbi:MAG: ABC transporter ATP-binding protein [Lachnospiraceae bacterium]|nr:ABC transporter ATP-binding protein [Lachnospiraceae bacterium]
MKTKSILSHLMRYLKRSLPLLLLALLLAAGSVILQILVPKKVGAAIDTIVGPGKVAFDALWGFLRTAGIFILISACCTWLMSLLLNRVSFRVVRDIRNDAINHITRLPLSYLDARSNGDIISRVVTDVDQVSDGLLLGFAQFFTGILTIVGTLVLMFLTNIKIALVVMLLTPLSLFVARFIASRTFRMFRAQSEARAKQTSLIDEFVGQAKIVQAYSYESRAAEQFNACDETLCDCALKATFFSSLTNPCTRFVNSTVYAACALVGSFAVIGGSLSVGMLTTMLAYAGQYAKPFNEISGVVTELQNALACAARIFELLDEPLPEVQTEDASLPQALKGDINFSHVAFSYVPERPLITDMNISVNSGMRIAIVGPTGCGKTTLINLLMRFYEINDGEITFDGLPLKDIPKSFLRKNIGMVLQDTWLSDGTIRDNIAMGKPDATDEEIKEAAKAAHAHSFIRRLPNGYDTVLGEHGGGLSAGQRQLLCIARVMLCLPPILILDEATSSIDTRTEWKIQDAFATMMKGRTSFIVAHRLSTIKNADLILVMKDGNVIEQGTHDTLMAGDTFYRTLYLAGSREA